MTKNDRFFKTSSNQRIVIYNNVADPQLPFHGAYRATKDKWGILQFSNDLKTVRHFGPQMLGVIEIDEAEYLTLHAKELLEEEPRFMAMAIEQAAATFELFGQTTSLFAKTKSPE